MTVDLDTGEQFTCQAGRLADFGGRWLLPCTAPTSPNRHRLVTAAGNLELEFCEQHMRELIAAGLISDPYISREGAEHLAAQERSLILHDSEWECDECGGPSPATSMSGCSFCGGQGDIVRRGFARRRTWRPRRGR